MARLPLALLCLLLSAAAQAAGARSYAEIFLTDDNEDLTQRSWLLGQSFAPQGAIPARASLAAGQRRYEDRTRNREFDTVRGELEVTPGQDTQLRARLQPLWGEGWTPLLASFSLTQRFGERAQAEFSLDRELVDSLAGLQQHLTLDSASSSVDLRLASAWTLVAGGSLQDLDDGNDRRGRLLRLVWSPAEAPWALQLRGRRLDSEFRSPAYFSPRRLEEALLLGSWRQPLFGGKALLSFQAGGGQQWIDRGDGEALYQGEIKLRGWLDERWGLESRLSCSNTGGFGGDTAGSGYRYCEALLTLLRAW